MPERKKGRSRLAGVRLGRSSAGPSSPSHRRGSGSGSSGGRNLRLAVRPAQGSRSRPPREGRTLARSASDPALSYGARVHPAPRGLSPPSPPPPPLERPHTCFDVFSPDSPFGRSASAASLPNRNPWEEAKVVVSVVVEGSVGPVKAMVRLGTSVGEAIAAVVERYGREGRSPRPPQRPSSSITPTSSSKAPPLPDELVEISIGILSSGNHFAERMGVRKTWMSAIQKSPNVVARFFVALPNVSRKCHCLYGNYNDVCN